MTSYYINPKTGDFEIVANKAVTSSDIIYKANKLLKQRIGLDIYNPNLGNPILNKKQGEFNRDEIINDLNFALSPLLTTGQLDSFTLNSYKYLIAERRTQINLTINPPNNPPILLQV